MCEKQWKYKDGSLSFGSLFELFGGSGKRRSEEFIVNESGAFSCRMEKEKVEAYSEDVVWAYGQEKEHVAKNARKCSEETKDDPIG